MMELLLWAALGIVSGLLVGHAMFEAWQASERWRHGLRIRSQLRGLSVHDRLRAHMAALGFPVWDMTDDGLEQGVEHMGEVMQSYGITAAEACDALESFGRAGR